MNTKQRTLAFVIFLMISLVMSGCGSGGLFGPTFTPSSTNTPVPSSTPTLTSTFTPTMTPSPTFTPTPTIEPPSQLQNIFEGASLTYYEGFDVAALEQWNTKVCQTVNNSILEYACTGKLLSRTNSLHEGEGLLIDFKHINQTGTYWWGINLVSGNYGQDDWRNFGIAESERGAYIDLTKGTTNPIGFPSFSIKPDVWYRLALAIGENGRITILTWERDNPNVQPLKFTNTLGKDWSGLEWLLWINSGDQNVVLDLDNYYQFTFKKIK